MEPKNSTKEQNKELINRCPIWDKGDEIINELGRSMLGFHIIVAKLLKVGVKSEKVTYGVVTKVYVDHFGAELLLDNCIEKYNLK